MLAAGPVCGIVRSSPPALTKHTSIRRSASSAAAGGALVTGPVSGCQTPGQPPFETLQVGERVVTHGGVELAAELESLQTAAKTTALTDTSVSSDAAKSTP